VSDHAPLAGGLVPASRDTCGCPACAVTGDRGRRPWELACGHASSRVAARAPSRESYLHVSCGMATLLTKHVIISMVVVCDWSYWRLLGLYDQQLTSWKIMVPLCHQYLMLGVDGVVV